MHDGDNLPVPATNLPGHSNPQHSAILAAATDVLF
jgi:hypothetical protein